MSHEDEAKLYNFLLQKYADLINEREQRTIGEIKALVDGTDLSIQNLVEEMKEDNYSFDENYEKTIEKTFNFIEEDISFIDPDINLNYWLSPREVLEIKIADDEDLAVFLCACMKALGDDKAEVIIAELDNLKTHAFVITEIREDFLLLDPCQKKKFNEYRGNKADILGKYAFNGEKIKRFLYRFNSDKYEQFLE